MTNWQPGDIVAFQTPGLVSAIIRLVTFGRASHVGIVCDHAGSLCMFESTTIAAAGQPCIIQGKAVQGVQVHWVEDAVKRPGKIWRYPIAYPLSVKERRRLKIFLASQLGRGYDYAGAIASGPRLLRWTSWLFRGECLDQEFCSELVAAAYERLLRFDVRSASVYNPNNLLRRLRRWKCVKKPVRIK